MKKPLKSWQKRIMDAKKVKAKREEGKIKRKIEGRGKTMTESSGKLVDKSKKE